MILKFVRGLIAGGPYYLRLNRDRVSIRNVSTGKIVEVTPKIGMDASNILLSVGDPVAANAIRVRTPFEHPRVLIADFTAGERIIQYVIREVIGKGAIASSPIVVVHPDVELEGGLTQIEARALREMVEGAGARKVYLHYGRQLTDQEVANLSIQDFDAGNNIN